MLYVTREVAFIVDVVLTEGSRVVYKTLDLRPKHPLEMGYEFGQPDRKALKEL